MPLHLGPRLHAFIGGLGKPSEAGETIRLYRKVEALFAKHHLLYADSRVNLAQSITIGVLEGFKLDEDHPQDEAIASLVLAILDYEQLFILPDFRPDQTYTVAQYWDIRNELTKQLKLIEDYDESFEHLRLFFCNLLDPIFEYCPQLANAGTEDGISVTSRLTHMVGNIGWVIEKMAKACSFEDFAHKPYLEHTKAKLDYNLIIASGGNPNDPSAFSRAPKYPSKSDIQDPKALISTYLGGTPLAEFFAQDVEFIIPSRTRFEHHHIVAGSGHGKTQTLQNLILKDLGAVARGERSIVVIDSQGDLINNISNLAVFGEDGPLRDRIVIIDPTDVEWPVSLNLFDIGQDRLENYSLLERERLTNSILELYDFVLGSLLDAGMTQKQNVIFRYVTRLMLHIPNATIHTLRELMEEGSEVTFATHFSKLSGSARHFFETEFGSKEFTQTKRQVLRRLWGILENQTFERMFSHPKSKLDLFTELNSGKVILINTAKDLLKESGTEIFGRFFIALIAQAAQERATLPKSERIPTFVYIDEAEEYFDRNIGIILSQSRKYNIGMILAHQYLGQLDPKLQEAFAANTSIKMAGGVSAKDARVLSGQMHADPLMIERQKKGSFATYLRGITPHAIPLNFEFFLMEKMQKLSKSERHSLQEMMRERYSVHYSELAGIVGGVEAGTEADADAIKPSEPIDPLEPTKGW